MQSAPPWNVQVRPWSGRKKETKWVMSHSHIHDWFPPWKNPKLEVSKAFHNPVDKLARYIALFSNTHYACQHRVIVWLYPACWKANRWYCKVFRLWQVFRLFVKKTPTWLVIIIDLNKNFCWFHLTDTTYYLWQFFSIIVITTVSTILKFCIYDIMRSTIDDNLNDSVCRLESNEREEKAIGVFGKVGGSQYGV